MSVQDGLKIGITPKNANVEDVAGGAGAQDVVISITPTLGKHLWLYGLLCSCAEGGVYIFIRWNTTEYVLRPFDVLTANEGVVIPLWGTSDSDVGRIVGDGAKALEVVVYRVNANVSWKVTLIYGDDE